MISNRNSDYLKAHADIEHEEESWFRRDLKDTVRQATDTLQAGYKAGYDEGYRAGYSAAMADAQKIVKEHFPEAADNKTERDDTLDPEEDECATT